MSIPAIPVEVRLGAAPRDREDAVRRAGALLVEAGHADAAYVDSLLRREEVENTFLGQGVAIPHGMVQDKHLVRRTGLAVLQVPAGVRWGDGEERQARLVVAIAAASDQHIAVLRRLTRLMRDEALMQRLATTADAGEIVRALTGDESAAAADAAALEDFALARELTLDYPNGLHARPAGQWALVAKRFRSRLHVRCGDSVVDATSMAALLSLGAGRGAELRLSADGDDAPAALSALADTVQRLGAEENRQADVAAARQAQAQGLGRELGDWHPAARQAFTGIAASPGLVIGTLVRTEAAALAVEDRFAGVAAEAAALDRALAAAAAELAQLAGAARAAGKAEQAGIFEAHAALLQDAELMSATSREVVAGHGVAWSWRQAVADRVAVQQALPDATLAARAADLQDAGVRVLRHLLGTDTGTAAAETAWPADAILLADDLSPSVTAQIDTSRVRGFCTARGGPTAHTAILARALGLPAVVAAGSGVLGPDAVDGTTVILDGYRGRLYLAPTAAALAEAEERIARLERRRLDEARGRRLPATTLDGHTLEIAANANRADEALRALEAGAEGVGLMRTEFLFLERDDAPDEETQYLAYRAMVEALAGKPLVVRTLDIGGDKQVPHLDLPVEENPFLGVRGARLCLRRDDLLVPQLRALYRAAKHGPLSVMFPMISTVEEVRQLRERMEQVRRELDAPQVPVGIMIEVPSAALMADRLAAHVDFFSIGTNDLTQYTLAVDRQHPELAGMADSLHPSVLRLVERTVAGARRHGRWVGVCGGLAGEPLGAALLAGLGVNELSMSSGDIGGVKALLRRHSIAELQQMARQALDVDTADEVRALGAALRPAAPVDAAVPVEA